MLAACGLRGGKEFGFLSIDFSMTGAMWLIQRRGGGAVEVCSLESVRARSGSSRCSSGRVWVFGGTGGASGEVC